MARRVIAGVLVAIVLAGVFAAYLRPDLAITLATQLWNCF